MQVTSGNAIQIIIPAYIDLSGEIDASVQSGFTPSAVTVASGSIPPQSTPTLLRARRVPANVGTTNAIAYVSLRPTGVVPMQNVSITLNAKRADGTTLAAALYDPNSADLGYVPLGSGALKSGTVTFSASDMMLRTGQTYVVAVYDAVSVRGTATPAPVGKVRLLLDTTNFAVGTPGQATVRALVTDLNGNVYPGTYPAPIALAISDPLKRFTLSQTVLTSNTSTSTLSYGGGAGITTAATLTATVQSDPSVGSGRLPLAVGPALAPAVGSIEPAFSGFSAEPALVGNQIFLPFVPSSSTSGLRVDVITPTTGAITRVAVPCGGSAPACLDTQGLPPTNAAVSPDGSTVWFATAAPGASLSNLKGHLFGFSTSTLQAIANIPLPARPYAIATRPGSSNVYVMDYTGVESVSTVSGTIIGHASGGICTNAVHCMASSPDGKYLVTGSSYATAGAGWAVLIDPITMSAQQQSVPALPNTNTLQVRFLSPSRVFIEDSRGQSPSVIGVYDLPFFTTVLETNAPVDLSSALRAWGAFAPSTDGAVVFVPNSKGVDVLDPSNFGVLAHAYLNVSTNPYVTAILPVNDNHTAYVLWSDLSIAKMSY